MPEERLPSRVFGEVAEDYDRIRPPYPDALIDDVLDYGPYGGEPALEVGAGTGRATVAFAARGVPVTAVEPDERMADVLARRTAHLGTVRIVRATFEDCVFPEGHPCHRTFDLLYSAEAWHWTDPKTRWARAAASLSSGGTLALFWNNERIADAALRRTMLDLLAEFTPSVVVRDEPAVPDRFWDRWPGDELGRAVEFEDLAARVYPSRKTVPGADYLTLMGTRSQCRMLPPPVRRALFAALADVFDGEVPLAIETVLLLARRGPR